MLKRIESHAPIVVVCLHRMMIKKLRRTLNGYKVYCPYEEKGCTWIGALGQCDAHLNRTATVDSLYIGCPCQEIHCGHCQFLCERQQMSDHLSNKCPHRDVKCKYHFAGCEVKRPQEEMENHLREAMESHIFLIAKSISQCTSDLKSELKKQQRKQHQEQLAEVRKRQEGQYQEHLAQVSELKRQWNRQQQEHLAQVNELKIQQQRQQQKQIAEVNQLKKEQQQQQKQNEKQFAELHRVLKQCHKQLERKYWQLLFTVGFLILTVAVLATGLLAFVYTTNDSESGDVTPVKIESHSSVNLSEICNVIQHNSELCNMTVTNDSDLVDEHELDLQQEVLTSNSVDKDVNADKEIDEDTKFGNGLNINDQLTDSSIAMNVEPGTNDEAGSQTDPKMESDKASHLEVDKQVESQENMNLDPQADQGKDFYVHSVDYQEDVAAKSDANSWHAHSESEMESYCSKLKYGELIDSKVCQVDDYPDNSAVKESLNFKGEIAHIRKVENQQRDPHIDNAKASDSNQNRDSNINRRIHTSQTRSSLLTKDNLRPTLVSRPRSSYSKGLVHKIRLKPDNQIMYRDQLLINNWAGILLFTLSLCYCSFLMNSHQPSDRRRKRTSTRYAETFANTQY